MQSRQSEFERIRSVLATTDAEEPMSAREIVALLEDRGIDVDSSHRVATVLGRHAERGNVEVVRSQPYRYRLRTPEATG